MDAKLNILTVDKQTPIIIYGAATAGLKGYHSLKTQNGYNVVGFIDRRAKEIGMQYGLPVWSLDDNFPIDKECCLVCICVKNVFDHETIVAALIAKGFRYFTFVPGGDGSKESEELRTARKNYNLISGDANAGPYYELLPVPPIMDLPFFVVQDYAVLKEETESLVAAVALEQVFSFLERRYDDSIEKPTFLVDQLGQGVSLSLSPQISLFSFFSNGNGETQEYLELCGIARSAIEQEYGEGRGRILDTPAWRANIIENRKIIYDKMNESLELNYGFFVENAPICWLDEKKRLVMVSGKHRAAFFVAKGRKYIPLRIRKEDYEVILHRGEISRIQIFLTSRHIYKLAAPITHPYFYGFPSKMPNYYETVIYPAVFEISSHFFRKNTTEELTICNGFHDDGALSRCMKRMGCQTMTVISSDDSVELLDLLDDLFGLQHSIYKDKPVSADIVFCREEDQPENSDAKMLFLWTKQEHVRSVKGYSFYKRITHTLWEQQTISIYLYLAKTEEKD